MASKQVVLEGLKEKAYSFSEVKHIIGTITCVENCSPEVLRKGDVYIQRIGEKRRPVVIIHIDEELVYGIPLSTTQDDLNLCESKSRFFGEGYFAKQLVSAPLDYVRHNFGGVYDSPKVLNTAIKELKKTVEKALVIKK